MSPAATLLLRDKLPRLADTWMTPREQYGDVMFFLLLGFYIVVVVVVAVSLRSMATISIHYTGNGRNYICP